MIEIRGVNLSYGKAKVLRDINLDIPEGQTTVIMGESGSGKTSLLKLIIGLIKSPTGHIMIDGTDITKANGRLLSKIRHSMAMVFQSGALFDSLKVWENAGYPLREQRRLAPDEIRNEAEKWLDRLGLAGTAEMMPAELSGGMKMRVAIARAIITKPKVLLYDEPTSGLDPITVDNICDIILELERQHNITSVLVTHDLMTALRVGTHFVMLHEGEIIFEDSAEELLASEDAQVQEFVRNGLEVQKRSQSIEHTQGETISSPGALLNSVFSTA